MIPLDESFPEPPHNSGMQHKKSACRNEIAAGMKNRQVIISIQSKDSLLMPCS
jgi:hypothetical protein